MPMVSVPRLHQAGGSGSGTGLVPRLIFPRTIVSCYALEAMSLVAPHSFASKEEQCSIARTDQAKVHTALSGCAQHLLGNFQG